MRVVVVGWLPRACARRNGAVRLVLDLLLPRLLMSSLHRSNVPVTMAERSLTRARNVGQSRIVLSARFKPAMYSH